MVIKNSGAKLVTLMQVVGRLLFVLFSTTVLVFFSEKTYWYPQGYPILELILFYGPAVYACIWAIDYFRVRHLPALLLVASLFAFLVEGIITPVIYEAGLLDPIMPAYFIGWHGLLSLIFGWYLIRKWLVKGQWQRIAIGSVLFGFFWGLWSLTYWLPENVAEWQQLAAAGEPVSGDTFWSTPAFALYAFVFTVMLMAAQWLLGQGGWQYKFRPTRPERWLLFFGLIFLFGTLVLPVSPFAIFKLIALLTAVLLPLALNRQRQPAGSILTALVGPIKARHLLGLLLMPLMAALIYGLGGMIQPSLPTLNLILEMSAFVQILAGGGLFIWAILDTIRLSQIQKLAVQS